MLLGQGALSNPFTGASSGSITNTPFPSLQGGHAGPSSADQMNQIRFGNVTTGSRGGLVLGVMTVAIGLVGLWALRKR